MGLDNGPDFFARTHTLANSAGRCLLDRTLDTGGLAAYGGASNSSCRFPSSASDASYGVALEPCIGVAGPRQLRRLSLAFSGDASHGAPISRILEHSVGECPGARYCYASNAFSGVS